MKRLSPERDVAEAARRYLVGMGYSVRSEVPAADGSKRRLDLYGWAESSPASTVAVSVKVNASLGAFVEARRWLPGANRVYLAFRGLARCDDIEVEAILEGIREGSAVGSLVVVGAEVAMASTPARRELLDGGALLKSAREAGSSLLSPAGAAGGVSSKPEQKLADSIAAMVKESGGQHSLVELIEAAGFPGKFSLVDAVAARINAKSARHAGVMARRFGHGFLVMRR